MHLEDLERQQLKSSKALYKQKNVTIFLFCLSAVIFIVMMRRHKTAKQLQSRLCDCVMISIPTHEVD